MIPVVGADGCPGGWIAVRWGEAVTHHLCRSFAEVLAIDAAVIAVNMPIGFAENGKRDCERLARAGLGERQSSVFAVPSRAAVMCLDYRAACTVNQRHTDPPKKISKQLFHLFPKMREIDALMTPELQNRVFEVHPELAFWAMNGKAALASPKKIRGRPNVAGLDTRREFLMQTGFPLQGLPESRYRSSQAGADDLLDACACAWSARRILDGTAVRFPENPQSDAKGLRMEINA